MIQYKEMFLKNLLYCLLPSSGQFDETLERRIDRRINFEKVGNVSHVIDTTDSSSKQLVIFSYALKYAGTRSK